MRSPVTPAVLAAAALATLGSFVLGCEDGPPQTFRPAAGTLFNNGLPEASVDPSTGPLDASNAGTSATALCTADFKRKVWANMLTQPIVPPRVYGGIDLAGGDEWTQVKIEQIEQPPDPVTLKGGLCQGNPLPNADSNDGVVGWGDNNELTFQYYLNSHIVWWWNMYLGYTGTAKFHNRDNSHTYETGVGHPILRDNQPFHVPWSNTNCTGDPKNPCYEEYITELFNAIMVTFAPNLGIAFDRDDPNCAKSGTCLSYNDTETHQWLFGVRPMGFYFIGNTHVPQAIADIPVNQYGFLSKTLPFSSKLDGALQLNPAGSPMGPYATKAVGDLTPQSVCTLQLGQTYSNYLQNCVQPWDPKGPNANLNQVDLNKITGGHTHDFENIAFAVDGADEFFTQPASKLGQYGVVQDNDMPDPAATATEWYDDLFSHISFKNDLDSMGNQDMHGTGLVEREALRLMQLDISQDIPVNQRHPIGDTACYASDTYAPGCTGLEAFVAQGPALPSDTVGTTLRIQSEGTNGQDPCGTSWGSIMGPQVLMFCFADKRWGNVGGWFGETAKDRVVDVLGGGNVNSLPARLQDRRFYFYYYGVAWVKYLHAFGQYGASTTPAQVAAAPFDRESFFIDTLTVPGNDWDKIEYIDRSASDAKGVPLDFVLSAEPRGAQQNFLAFYQRLDREENAMYAAMLENKSDKPSQENNVKLTNLFGSPVLSAVYPSLQCATEIWNPVLPQNAPPGLCTMDPTTLAWSCNTCVPIANPATPGMVSCPVTPADYAPAVGMGSAGPCHGVIPPPLDATGATQMDLNGQMRNLDPANASAYPAAKPLLSYYPGVWGKTVFSKGPSAIKLDKQDLGVMGAETTIPNFLNPYGACDAQQTDAMGNITCDPAASTYASPIHVLVPFLPPQPGVGFPIPIDGQRDVFVNTGQLEFSGILETYTVDYLPKVDTVTPACAGQPCRDGFTCLSNQCVANDNSISIPAIEASDFVGAVFPCQDVLTGDILVVHQYDSVLQILDWLAAHPGRPPNGTGGVAVPSARDNCGTIVRFSPYDNYPDIISFNANGVWINSNPGNGYGRVSDVTLFDPSYTSLGQ